MRCFTYPGRVSRSILTSISTNPLISKVTRFGIDINLDDFYPTYNNLYGVLGVASVVLTVWEHACTLVANDNITFLYSGSKLCTRTNVWASISECLRARSVTFDPALSPDPLRYHIFERNVNVWALIQKYDPNLYDWAGGVGTVIGVSTGFACTRATLDLLGAYLDSINQRLTMADCGVWSPHMFERLIGLYLLRSSNIRHINAFRRAPITFIRSYRYVKMNNDML